MFDVFELLFFFKKLRIFFHNSENNASICANLKFEKIEHPSKSKHANLEPLPQSIDSFLTKWLLLNYMAHGTKRVTWSTCKILNRRFASHAKQNLCLIEKTKRYCWRWSLAFRDTVQGALLHLKLHVLDGLIG